MEFFGYKFSNHHDHLKETMEKAGICFLHAPLFHPAMKSIAPIRKELGVKTFFNMLGPLVNPSRPNVQMIGVFNLELARLYYYLFQDSGTRYLILHSLDGYDEISLTNDIKIFSNQGESVLNSSQFVPKPLHPEQVLGGKTLEESAKIFIQILEGAGTEAQTQVVLANSAMAIRCFNPEKPIESALEEARSSLHEKRAFHSFRKLIEMNKIQQG
jgi:anthranilate phosphoribosyltransferase